MALLRGTQIRFLDSDYVNWGKKRSVPEKIVFSRNMQNTLSPLVAYKRSRSLDSSNWYMGNLLTFLAESKDTGGSFTLLEGLLKPGNEPPPHVHGREDELFYVLEGEMDMYVGNEVFKTGPGECLFLPRLQPHTFIVSSPRLRTLVLFMPGGLEECFRARSARAGNLELPPEAATYSTSDLEPAIRAFEEYGARFLSPHEVAEQMPLYFVAINEANSLASIAE
jgi:mannose-6-phosphate isomerase-like protein (cupin superfamily)